MKEIKFSDLYLEPSKNGLSVKFVDDPLGYKIVNMKELFSYPIIKEEVEMRKVRLSHNELNRFKLKKGDLLFGRRSLVFDGAGKSTLFYSNEDDVIFESSIIRVRIDESKAFPMYLKYFFESPYGKSKIWEIIAGTAVFGIRSSELSNIKFNLPEISIQHIIANLLSSYDELIENNKQRIKLLEEMAEEIYKEWFVRFRFPSYENTKIVGGLPQGWERTKLDNVLETVKRKPKISKDKYLSQGKYPIVDQGDDFIAGYTNDENIVQFEPLPLLVFGDHTRRIKYIDFPFASGADGTQLLSPKNKGLLPIYFYISVKNIDLSNFHYSRHFKFLKQEYITIPDKIILSKFNNLVSPFFEEIQILKDKNQLLEETRDLLLPRLITGKLSVSHLIDNEEELGMVAEPREEYSKS